MRIILFILFISSMPCYSFTFPWDKLKPELNLLKADVAKNADSIAKVNADLNIKLNNTMTANADLKAQIQGLQAKISAVDKSVNTNTTNTIGRDQTTTTTNDTELMKDIINKWYLVVAAFIALLGKIIWLYERIIKAHQKTIDNLINRISVREKELDSWQQKTIDSFIEKKEVV